MLDSVALEDLLSKIGDARELASSGRSSLSGEGERRACHIIDADRESVRYRSIPDDDIALHTSLHGLANERRASAIATCTAA